MLNLNRTVRVVAGALRRRGNVAELSAGSGRLEEDGDPPDRAADRCLRRALLAGVRRAQLMAAAQEDRYTPPPNGRLSEEQVVSFIRVMEGAAEMREEGGLPAESGAGHRAGPEHGSARFRPPQHFDYGTHTNSETRTAVSMSSRGNLVSMVVATVGIFAGIGAPMQAQTLASKHSSVSFAQYQANMDQTYERLDRMIASLDKSRFELEPLIDGLDYDAEAIIKFVTGEIAFQQYPGVLRGARGTLMSRAGNALDQSLLLASLLRDAGYDARIVEGRLTETQVLDLMRAVQNPVRTGFSSAEAEALLGVVGELKSAQQQEQLVEDLATSLRGDPPRKNLESIDQLSEQNLEIIKSLKDLDMNLELRPVPHFMMDEAAQYFWVEYKVDADGPWKQVHPVFYGATESFSAATPVNYFTASIPEEYQQRITISVQIEQSIGGKVRRHQVVPPWTRPAASLYGMELTFSNVPMNFTGSKTPLGQEASLEAAEFFIPILSGVPASSMNVFDLSGNVAPADAVLDPASGIFKEVGKKMGMASAALNAASSSDGSSIADHIPKLVAQTVQIELQAPGSPPRTFTKSMIPDGLDGFDDAGQPTMALKDALTAQLTIGLAMGDYPDQFILSEILTRMKSSRPLFDAIHAGILDTDEDELWSKSRFSGLPTNWGRMSTLVALMHQAELPAGKVGYFAEPGLILHRFQRDRFRDLEGSLDIMSNTRRVFDVNQPELRVDPEAQVMLGVWDTTIEEVFYRRPRVSTARATAPDAVQPGFLLASGDDISQFAFVENQDMLRWMKRDLDAGFRLFVPEGMSGVNSGSIAWWRVNEGSGETLGMLVDGSGGAISVLPVSVQIPEWLAKMIVSVAVTGAFAYGGYLDCVGATQEEQCCAEMAIGATVVGGTIGWGIGMMVLWEYSVFSLFVLEVGINGGIGLYTSMDMFSELCTATIFGDSGDVKGLWPSSAGQFAFDFSAECTETSPVTLR